MELYSSLNCLVIDVHLEKLTEPSYIYMLLVEPYIQN
jgi:hypothetical protein